MSEKLTYIELLQDPRWQKKRLEIMHRDEFTCQDCFDGTSPLSVHHKYYIHNTDPWDYPNEMLITLCDNCHKSWEDDKYIINELSHILLKDGWSPRLLKTLSDLLVKGVKTAGAADLFLYEIHNLVNNSTHE
jgi:5-methylcytosine-specific restriction endonuclease McrA